MKRLQKILIVDDESDNLEALKRLLRKSFEVTTATSGEEALKVIEESPLPFDAIVSDQRMPGLTGSEFFERVQKIDSKATRVLLTGFADLEAIIEAVNRGHIWRYVAKPWEPDELKLTISQACERTILQRSLDESRTDLSRALIELKAKDWARERLFKILLHEFRTAPQIIEAIKTLEPNDDSSEERKRFLSRLSERFQVLESDISDLLSDEKLIAQLPKQRFSLKGFLTDFCLQNSLNPQSIEDLSEDLHPLLHETTFRMALEKIVALLSQNNQDASLSLSLDLMPAQDNVLDSHSVYISLFISSPGQKLLPKGLSKQNLEAPLAWRAVLEPFVGVDDFERHSQGLRVDVARVLRQLSAMGVRYDVQVSPTMDQVEFIFDLKIPRNN